MQKMQIIGNIGQNAELKTINGSEFITFSVACNKKITLNDGTVKEVTNWYSVLRKNAGKLAKYLIKGTKVFVEGDLSVNTYKNKDNNWVAGLNILASGIELLSSLRKEDENANNSESKSEFNSDLPLGNDDLPF